MATSASTYIVHFLDSIHPTSIRFSESHGHKLRAPGHCKLVAQNASDDLISTSTVLVSRASSSSDSSGILERQQQTSPLTSMERPRTGCEPSSATCFSACLEAGPHRSSAAADAKTPKSRSSGACRGLIFPGAVSKIQDDLYWPKKQTIGRKRELAFGALLLAAVLFLVFIYGVHRWQKQQRVLSTVSPVTQTFCSTKPVE